MPIGSNRDPSEIPLHKLSSENPTQSASDRPENNAAPLVPPESAPPGMPSLGERPASPRPPFGPQNSGIRIVQSPPVRPLQAPTAEADLPQPPESDSAPARHIGRKVKVLGAFVVLTLVGGSAIDLGLNHGALIDTVLSRIFNKQPGDSPVAETPTPSASETPRTAPTTSHPTGLPTKTVSKPSSTTPAKPKVVIPPVTLNPSGEQCVSRLPDATLIAQKIMAPVYGDNLAAMTKAMNDRHIGGVILMSSPNNPNDGSIKAFKTGQSIAIEVATDQEGGDPTDKSKSAVSRIKVPNSKLEPHGYMPAAADMAKMTPAQITMTVAENYAYLKSIGVDTSFGPVVDVAPVNGTTQIGASRIAGSDPATVITYAASYIAGAKQAGINPVIKHWGMGGANANTDTALAVAPTLAALKSRDFTVYTTLRADGLKVGGMIGSEAIPGLTISAGKDNKLGTADDIKTPASLSKPAVDLFKTDYLQKDVVTYTDDLGARAIALNSTVTKASVEAWKAGVDVGLFVHTDMRKGTPTHLTIAEQLDATIKEGVAAMQGPNPELSRQAVVASVVRLLLAKHVDGCAVLQKENPAAYKAMVAPTPTPSKSPASPAPTSTVPALKPTVAFGKQQASVKATAPVTSK